MAALWILNLDAELELAARRKGSHYAPSKDLLRSMERALPAARALMGAGDHELQQALDAGLLVEGGVGRAFCPTPSALERFRSAGVRPEPWPELEVVERVNDRGWALSHGLGPDCAHWFEDSAVLEAFLAGRPQAEDWLAKRALGTAGRGQRPLRAPGLSEADQRWLRASWPMGGVLLEPRREILVEYSLHAWLEPDGSLRQGRPVVFNTHGRAFVEACLLVPGECQEAEIRALESGLHKAASALHGAGYFGPFGVDAYAWSLSPETRYFEAISEVNARYTLAWALGMGD